MKVITTGYSQKDSDRGESLPGWGLLKAVRKARDRAAGLQSELERLNAVNPQVERVSKSKESVLVAYRAAHKHLKRGAENADKLEKQRKSTSLEFAYRLLKDKENGLSNPHMIDRQVENLIIKEEKFILAAYDRLPLICSLRHPEIDVLRASWAFTGVAITRAAFLKYRHKQACDLIEKMASGEIDSYVAYYLARKLVSMSSSNTPLKFDIRYEEFDKFLTRFEKIERDTTQVFERILSYQSTIKLHTRDKRDGLVDMVKFIAVSLRELEGQIVDVAHWRPEAPWVHGSLQPLDEFNPEYVERL